MVSICVISALVGLKQEAHVLMAIVEGQGLHRRTYVKEFFKSQPGGSVPPCGEGDRDPHC